MIKPGPTEKKDTKSPQHYAVSGCKRKPRQLGVGDAVLTRCRARIAVRASAVAVSVLYTSLNLVKLTPLGITTANDEMYLLFRLAGHGVTHPFQLDEESVAPWVGTNTSIAQQAVEHKSERCTTRATLLPNGRKLGDTRGTQVTPRRGWGLWQGWMIMYRIEWKMKTHGVVL